MRNPLILSPKNARLLYQRGNSESCPQIYALVIPRRLAAKNGKIYHDINNEFRTNHLNEEFHFVLFLYQIFLLTRYYILNLLKDYLCGCSNR